MVEKIKIKCIHCGHIWWTKSQAVNVCCGSCGRKTPARSRPERIPMKAPEGLKKARAKIGQPVDQGQTITGQVVYKPANARPLPSETIRVEPHPFRSMKSPITFRPSQHSLRMLRGSEVWKTPTEINTCSICGHKLFEDLRFNCMVDEKIKVHGAVLQSLQFSPVEEISRQPLQFGASQSLFYKRRPVN